MKRVTVYTLRGCPWCVKIKSFLRQRGIRFTEHEVARGEPPKPMLDGTKAETYPQVWVTSTRTGVKRRIGGYEATTAYVRAKTTRR